VARLQAAVSLLGLGCDLARSASWPIVPRKHSMWRSLSTSSSGVERRGIWVARG